MRIGELAALVGVSPRAVRHYHHVGLLPEPRRLANGYREYGLGEAVRLARVRRLTELGLSLDEVRDVLADDTGRDLHEVLAGLDADLARQEREIRERRERLAVLLRQAERGLLPDEGPVSPELAELFASMAGKGQADTSPMAAKDREMLAFFDTTAKPEARDWLLAMVRATTAGPDAAGRAREVYALLDDLAGAAPDDPRVARAARMLADCVPDEAVGAMARGLDQEHRGADAFREAFLADFAPAQAAALRGAMELLAERVRESR